MSKKKSAIDKAIDNLEGEIAVLQLALVKLKQQQAKAPVRKPKLLHDPLAGHVRPA